MICEKCGEDLTGKGLLYWCNHPCNIQTIEYKGAVTNGKMREMFLELGMSLLAFEAFNYTPPTEMERIIYQKNHD